MAYQVQKAYQIISAQSMGASITSAPQEIQYQDNIGVQLTWTGAPVGVFSVQVSADYKQDIEGNVVNAGNWVTLPLNPSISAAGSADSAYMELNQLSAPYMRIVYTRTSGTGTLNGYVTGKAV